MNDISLDSDESYSRESSSKRSVVKEIRSEIQPLSQIETKKTAKLPMFDAFKQEEPKIAEPERKESNDNLSAKSAELQAERLKFYRRLVKYPTLSIEQEVLRQFIS